MSRERNIIVSFSRRGKVHSMRHYCSVDTAAPRATQLLMRHGHPGDVAEIAHTNGRQFGTARVKAGGEVVAKWTWDQVPDGYENTPWVK